MAAVDTLKVHVGGQLFVKAANPADITKAAFESVFTSGAEEVKGWVSGQIPSLKANFVKQGGIDGHERVGKTSRMIDDITATIRHDTVDAGRDILIANVAVSTPISCKYINPVSGKIDYWVQVTTAMMTTVADSETAAGYEMTASVPSNGILLGQTAPA